MEKQFGVISADGHCRLMHLPFDFGKRGVMQVLGLGRNGTPEPPAPEEEEPNSPAVGHSV